MANEKNNQPTEHERGMATLGIAIGFVASTVVNIFLAVSVVPILVQEKVLETEIAQHGGVKNYNSWIRYEQDTLKDYLAKKNLTNAIDKTSSEQTVPVEVKIKRAQNSISDGSETKVNVRDALNTQLKGRKLLTDEQQEEILQKRELAKKFLDNTKEYDIFRLPSEQFSIPTE